MNLYYNLYKKCTNCMNLYYNLYKCMNLYYTICKKRTNYMNPYVLICTKISEKKRTQVGISTRDQYGLQSSQRHAIHHPAASISAHFIYIP
jgi:hypothetical protein